MTDDDPAAKFGDALSDAILHIDEDERFKKSKQHFLDNLWDDVQYSVIGNMSEALEGLVRDMTDRAIDAMLKGQPDQVRRYLHLDGYTGRERDHPIIHGRLHENNCIQLRRQLVEAHADLIRDERVTDLEDIAASLEKQVAERDRTIEALRNRLRDGE